MESSLFGYTVKNDISYNMTRLSAVKNSEGDGFTIMHLINADVLPSFLEDDEIEAQVVAYALDVHYYEDEGAFAATVPECESVKCENLNGYKILPARRNSSSSNTSSKSIAFNTIGIITFLLNSIIFQQVYNVILAHFYQ